MTIALISFAALFVVTTQANFLSQANTQSFENNNALTKTNFRISGVNASSNSYLVNFTLNNEGTEKLWNYDDFDLIIQYDADVSGIKNRITEKFLFNDDAFEASTGQAITNPEFKIQHNELIMTAAETSSVITEGTDFNACTGDCFIKLVNTRNTGNGRTDNGGNQGVDSWTTYISDDSGLTTPLGTVTFTRDTTDAHDNRLQWEIWEYIGGIRTDNEMIVWDTGVCTFSTISSSCAGSQITGFTGDDKNVVVFVTGQGNPDNGLGNFPSCMTTSEWIGDGQNIPRFSRIEIGGDACDISYAVVEFSGYKWSVQRIEHSYTNDVFQIESIENVGDISNAFFHNQQRNEDTGTSNSDAICQVGAEIELTSPTVLTYKLPRSTTGWGSANMQGVTWIVSNSENRLDEKMIVSHINPPFEDASGALPQEFNWKINMTSPLTYGVNETAITGMTAQSANGVTCTANNYPQGSISANLTDSTTVDLWTSDTGAHDDYAFQVTEFPRLQKCVGGDSDDISSNEWMINCIMHDYFEPGIINSQEEAEILVRLEYPMFANGVIEVSLSSENGHSTSQTITAN